jgi:mitogen-activated protein kinase 1/3
VGKLSDEDINSIDDEHSRRFLRSYEEKMKMTTAQTNRWKDMFPDANPLAIDLLEKLVSFNPNKRITVYDAIKHPYFAEISKLETPPVA